ASAYRRGELYADAIKVYEELVTLDPERADDWRWQIANSYHEMGKHREALASYRQCNPTIGCFQQMARCHRSLKEYKEALVLYSQIINESQPHAPWATMEIARTYEQSGNPEAAIKTFQNLCKKYPK